MLELAALWGLFGLRPEQVAPWLSAAFTAGTIAAMLWWVTRLPNLHNRGLVGWMALGLVCSSATFAVWTPAGGLETRQCTLFIVVAVVCLSLYRESRRGLLAAAALTRPEGLLIAACCFAWFVVERTARDRRLRLDWGVSGRAVRDAGGGTLPVPLRLLQRVVAQHLLRQGCAALVGYGLSLLCSRRAGDRTVPAGSADDGRTVGALVPARDGSYARCWCASDSTRST